MSVYQKDIARIMKHLMLQYETKIAFSKSGGRKLERLSVMEIAVLEHVMHHEEITQNDLVDFLKIKRSKALSIIKKMIDVGYLKKTVNASDRRSIYIHLDHAGEKLMADYYDHENQFLDFVLRDMTINEEKAIVKFLSKINQTEYMK